MPKMDRREFLATGAAGTASIALPVLGSGCAAAPPSPVPAGPVGDKDLGPNATVFRVALVTDSHVRLETDDPQNIYPSDRYANDKNRHVVRQINKTEPDLVIHLGDIPHTIPDSENHEPVMRNAAEIYKEGIRAPFHIAAGNHDIGDKPGAFAASPTVDEKGHMVFEKYFGSTYSSFDFKGCHFTLLSAPVLNSGLPIEKEQRKWLTGDLAAAKKAGKRIFLCLHFPLYLNNPGEGEHYDNVGEPARSWLLSLLEKYAIEAVFAGHAHNFFYNLHGNTDLYALPSLTFVRPDFSAMFHVGPTEEYGRADINKLGFSMLEVKERGHELSIVRTYGLTEDRDDTVVEQPRNLSGKTEVPPSKLGVSLRHAYAKTVFMPFDSLDEFARKPIRNDYYLQALFELKINNVRVPIFDLKDPETLERIIAMKRLGMAFTFFTVGVPTKPVVDTIVANRALVDNLEVVVPRLKIGDTAPSLTSIKKGTGANIYLSVIDVLADQKSDPDFVFSHFPSHGFKVKEKQLLTQSANQLGSLIDGFVFRVTQKTDAFEGIEQASRLAKSLGQKALVNLKMPRKNEGQSFDDDLSIAGVVSAAHVAAVGLSNTTVFLDTFVDHDRGYFPRHGLMDRRYNPRLPYHVLRHLHHAIASKKEVVTQKIKGGGCNAFAISSKEFECALVLPDPKVKQRSFKIDLGEKSKLAKGPYQALDLHTGRTRDVNAKPSDDGRITIPSLSGGQEPFLLITRDR